MSNTKKAGKGGAVVPAKRTEVTLPEDWEQQLAKYATQASKTAEASAGGGSWLSFKGGVLTYKGVPVQNNETELVVLDQVLENLYYEGAYDPNTPTSPVCFALAREKDELVPHEKSPSKQSDDCASCEHNKFGSAAQGRGKACKNSQRLAVLAVGDGSLEQLAETEVTFAKLPVTSVANYANYVQKMQALYSGMPPFAFVTRLKLIPDAKSQFKVLFDFSRRLTKEELGVVFSRVKEAEPQMIPADPYPPFETPAPISPARGRSAKATPVKATPAKGKPTGGRSKF